MLKKLLGFIKSKLKSKMTLIGLGVVLAGAIAFKWLLSQHQETKEELFKANENISQLESSLNISRNSFQVLQYEKQKQNEIIQKRREERRKNQKKLNELSKALKNEKEQNKEFQECLHVNIGKYADELQSFSQGTSDRNEDGDNQDP